MKVYADDGISGCNRKYREGFNEMITDAMNGKIDLIVTKSVSRFARNTVDSLTTIRELKEKGVEVYFEKENIYTFDSKGELLLTIMSSLAQEESRSISENVTWGQRKRFADGKVSLPYKQFLGYRKGADGLPEIVQEEAEVVRKIYALFMEGRTVSAIAKELTENEIPTPSGKKIWSASTVKSILKNEKYKGAALLQKQFTVDFLTKKMKVNEGEVPQYYIEHSHEPIIDPEEFDKVQIEFERRKKLGCQYSGISIFSTRIVCGDCGAFYGPKIWNSTGKYRRIIWQCNGKFEKEEKCRTPHLDEQTIKISFVLAFQKVLAGKNQILDDCRLMMDTLMDCSGVDAEICRLQEKLGILAEQAKQYVSENAKNALNQEEYETRYNALAQAYETAKAEMDNFCRIKSERQEQAKEIEGFMEQIQTRSDILEFDEKLWLAVIDTVTVHADGKFTFRFKDRTELIV